MNIFRDNTLPAENSFCSGYIRDLHNCVQSILLASRCLFLPKKKNNKNAVILK